MNDIAKVLTTIAFLLFLPIIASASEQPQEETMGKTRITIECEIYLTAGKPVEILDCEIIGLVPLPRSGE